MVNCCAAPPGLFLHLGDIAPLKATRRYSTLQVIPICWLTRPPCNRDGGRYNGSICHAGTLYPPSEGLWYRCEMRLRMSFAQIKSQRYEQAPPSRVPSGETRGILRNNEPPKPSLGPRRDNGIRAGIPSENIMKAFPTGSPLLQVRLTEMECAISMLAFRHPLGQATRFADIC